MTYADDLVLLAASPKALRRMLRSLEKLNLGFNKGLIALPSTIGGLENLKELLLNSCGLTTLPEEIGTLSPQCEIVVTDNPLREPPLEVCQKGVAVIRAYFEQRDQVRFSQAFESMRVLIVFVCVRVLLRSLIFALRLNKSLCSWRIFYSGSG